MLKFMSQASLELLAKKLLCKVRSIEQSFGYRPVPSLSLSLRHSDGVDGPPRRERRQMQLGRQLSVGDPRAVRGARKETLQEEAAEQLSEGDLVIARQLAEQAFGLFQKLVSEPFSLNILNLQVAFADVVKGQQSLSFKLSKASKATPVDLELPSDDVAALVAMGFGEKRAEEALREVGSVSAAVERLLKKPRLEVVELVELD